MKMNKFLKVKKVNVLKLAFIFAIMYGILSAIMIIIMSLFELVSSGDGIGFVLVIFMPFLYAIAGFLSGLISGSLYNLISKWIGGVEVEVEEIEKFSE